MAAISGNSEVYPTMTTPTPPTRLQLTEDQYVADLASLFRRYRLASGAPACLHDLGPELQANPALRGDLFNLCTAISHMGESDLSAQELLLLVARASGGPRFASGELEIPATTRKIFLELYEQWSARIWESMASETDEAKPGPAANNIVWPRPTGRFSAAAAREGDKPSPHKAVDDVTDTEQSITPETPIGELTISQLRTYLDDIESRVGRLKPYFEPVGGTGENGLAVESDVASVSNHVDDTAATHIDDQKENDGLPALTTPTDHPDNEDGTSTSIRAAESFKGTSTDQNAQIVVPNVLSEASLKAEQTSVAGTKAIGTSPAHPEPPPMILLPLRLDRGETAEQTMFRSVEDDTKSGSRTFPWLAAAVLLVGTAAGYEYRSLQRAHAVPTPAVAQPIPEASGSDEGVRRPDGPTPVHPQIPGVAGRKTVVPTNAPAGGRRHRQAVSQPRLLPHEVQMEAEAARAGAAAGANSSGVPNGPR